MNEALEVRRSVLIALLLPPSPWLTLVFGLDHIYIQWPLPIHHLLLYQASLQSLAHHLVPPATTRRSPYYSSPSPKPRPSIASPVAPPCPPDLPPSSMKRASPCPPRHLVVLLRWLVVGQAR